MDRTAYAGEYVNRLSGLNRYVRKRARWSLDIAEKYGVPVKVTSGYRSLREQKRLRQRWLAGQSPWPANKPGDSGHNYGLAWDSVTTPEYQRWWNYVRRYAGFNVPPHDEIHAEVPNWRNYI